MAKFNALTGEASDSIFSLPEEVLMEVAVEREFSGWDREYGVFGIYSHC